MVGPIYTHILPFWKLYWFIFLQIYFFSLYMITFRKFVILFLNLYIQLYILAHRSIKSNMILTKNATRFLLNFIGPILCVKLIESIWFLVFGFWISKKKNWSKSCLSKKKKTDPNQIELLLLILMVCQQALTPQLLLHWCRSLWTSWNNEWCSNNSRCTISVFLRTNPTKYLIYCVCDFSLYLH